MSVGPAGMASGLRQSLWVPGPLPGLNEMIAAAKGCGGTGAEYARMKREQTDKVHLLAKASKMRPVRRARLVFAWTEKARRRDPDNICAARKFLLDGLVAAGVLPGDGWGDVVGFHDTWTVDPGRPGVLVVVEEAAI